MTPVLGSPAEIALQIIREGQSVPRGRQRLQKYKEGVDRYCPPEWAGAVQTLLSCTEEELMVQVDVDERSAQRRDRRFLAVGGAVFVLILLAINLYVPNPTRSQERAFVIVLALAAAGVGAIMPGAISVDAKFRNWKVRATSAIGFFVFILLIYRFLI